MHATPKAPLSQPPFWRVVLAFVMTPAIVTITALLWGGNEVDPIGFLMVGTIGTLPATLIGLLLYIVLRHRLRPTPWSCGLAAAFAAVLAWAGIFIVDGTNESTDTLSVLAAVGAGGFIAGLIFWLIAAAGFRYPSSAAD